MASPEQKSGGEKAGEVVRTGGLIAAAIGIIGIVARSEFAASFLFPGVIIFAAGEAGRQYAKNKREKRGR